MDLMLKDKVAVVTGASKGIGMAVARELAAEGVRVVAGARSISTLKGFDNVTAVAVDLSETNAPALLVQRAIDEFGRLDILVNNVGAVKLRLDGFLSTTDEDFAWAMEMNFFTALRRQSRRVGVDGISRWGSDRECLFGQRLLPTRRRDYRLRRGQGRVAQFVKVTGAGVWSARDPCELCVAGSSEYGPLVRGPRSGRDSGSGHGG